MRYIPNSPKDMATQEIDALFSKIIPGFTPKTNLLGFEPSSEIELRRHFKGITNANKARDLLCFLGAGAYDHYIPSIVDNLSARSEFITSYTQYQPELSQGMLQALFEFQTMVAELLKMKIVNSSMYDGASALAEAVLMASRIAGGEKRRVLVSGAINPLYKEVLKTYCIEGAGLTVDYMDITKNGATDLSKIKRLGAQNDVACVVMQNPNFFGFIENLNGLANIIHAKQALFVLSVYPLSLGILKTPGELDADIAVGEAQSLGMPLGFGGPYAGFFASKEAHLRQMPGRLVGETTDSEGRRAYTLTISTREQHIRREGATSNICTNQALCALRAAIYLATMGESGIREAAKQCASKAHYLASRITSLKSFRLISQAPFFNEFLVASDIKTKIIQSALRKRGIMALFAGNSINLPPNTFLVAVTEQRTKEELDYFAETLKEVEDAHAAL